MMQPVTPTAFPVAIHPVLMKWMTNFALHLLPLGVGVAREWVSLSKDESRNAGRRGTAAIQV